MARFVPVSALFAAIAASAFYAPAAHAGQDCTSGPFVKGVDVYDGQGAIDWVTANGAGIEFAYIKASQGTYDTDSQFAANWAGTKAAGVTRGAYHFLDPTISGVDQANFYLNIVGTIGPDDLPPMLDIECPSGNDESDSDDCLGTGSSGDASGTAITKVMNDWLTTVEAATGRKPVIYTYGSYFDDDSIDTTGLQNYPLYIAYPTTSGCFDYPDPWTAATFWQYSFTGTVAGISGQVDLDYFLGTPADLATFNGSFAAPAQVNGNDALSLVNWADGHIELYGTKTGGTAARIDTTASEAAPADTWSAPVALDGSAACGVASVYWAPGSGHTTEVFDGLPDGTTESLEYVKASSSWTSFTAFGGAGLSHLSTLAYGDSHVEVFALGTDGNVWHDVSTQNSWGGWAVLGSGSGTAPTFATGAGPILWNDGHAEVFATDTSGVVWHDATDTSHPPVWQGWSQIGGGKLASRPIPARWADGHVEVFGRGVDGALYASASSSTTIGTFPAFAPLNPTQTIVGEPSVLVYSAYGPEIFARNAEGDVIHMWNGSGSWSTWANDFGQVLASDPLAWMRPDGVAEVFGIDGSGNVVKSLHDSGDWSTWATIGTGFDACKGGVTPDAGGQASGDGGSTKADGGKQTGADGGVSNDGGSIELEDGGVVSGSDGGVRNDGSRTSADGGFASPSSGGCTLASSGTPGDPRAGWVGFALTVASVLFGRRRRTRTPRL